MAPEPGGTGSRRLLLTDTDSGVPHYALVTHGATAPSADVLSAAKAEPAAWAAARFWRQGCGLRREWGHLGGHGSVWRQLPLGPVQSAWTCPSRTRCG
ncbi:hypothetical protein GCM10010300_43130 [Streptomyces olivaceoviridis]|nr:hypothetical protein GCM10010300_43130 [Streptomyces olivaceoviridis]